MVKLISNYLLSYYRSDSDHNVKSVDCAEGALQRMENINKDQNIQVKTKFVDHVKFLSETNSLLSGTLRLHQVEEHHDHENEPFACFRVEIIDELSKFTSSEIQVISYFASTLINY